MNKTLRVKISVDIGMTALLFVLMAYQITGELAHEWAGAAMLVLFLAHHLLNRRWFSGLSRGRYTPLRLLQTSIDLLLLLCMLGLMISGIVLSRYVFGFLPITGGAAAARRAHLLASHWGFVLMSVHLGLHWGMVVGMVRKAAKLRPSKTRAVVLRAAAAGAAVYGAYAFWQTQFWQYLFLLSEFVWFDFSRPPVFFFLDHLAIMALFVLLSYLITRLLQTRRNGGARP